MNKISYSIENRRNLLLQYNKVLEEIYHSPRHGNLYEPTSELIYVMLSVRTPIELARKVFKYLETNFHPWDKLCDVSTEQLIEYLEPIGLWQKRGNQII